MPLPDPILDALIDVLQLEDEARQAAVAGLIQRHPELAAEIQSLADGDPAGPRDWLGALPGERFGAYELIEKLASGGFGTVYRARQSEPLARTVALKLLSLANSRAILARFHHEGDVLAYLDHPGIAKIYDAGVSSLGRPFLVMELIAGCSITRYCDERSLGLAERLRLFVEVCRAVHHAHQKGVIHRDLKPSNILVSEKDGRPCPKIIDFGIAKVLDRSSFASAPPLTQGGAAPGTPEYMSPEQAAELKDAISTRTDVYSLGVVLYELLAGTLPFPPERLRGKGQVQIARILSSEETPRPSTQFHDLPPAGNGAERSRGASQREVAARRSTTPQSLTRFLAGEVDWIVLKALEKSPDQRYGSADELARDVQRFLDGEPVAARPGSMLYRLRKFARREPAKVGYGAAAGVVALLLLGYYGQKIDNQKVKEASGEALLAWMLPRELLGEQQSAAAGNLDQMAAGLLEAFRGNQRVPALALVAAAHNHEFLGYDQESLGFYRAALPLLDDAGPELDLARRYARLRVAILSESNQQDGVDLQELENALQRDRPFPETKLWQFTLAYAEYLCAKLGLERGQSAEKALAYAVGGLEKLSLIPFDESDKSTSKPLYLMFRELGHRCGNAVKGGDPNRYFKLQGRLVRADFETAHKLGEAGRLSPGTYHFFATLPGRWREDPVSETGYRSSPEPRGAEELRWAADYLHFVLDQFGPGLVPHPHPLWIRRTLAAVLMEAGRFDEALAAVERILEVLREDEHYGAEHEMTRHWQADLEQIRRSIDAVRGGTTAEADWTWPKLWSRVDEAVPDLPSNLDFEEGDPFAWPQEWRLARHSWWLGRALWFEPDPSSEEGGQSLRFAALPGPVPPADRMPSFGQQFSARAYAGRKIRASAWLTVQDSDPKNASSENPPGEAYLFAGYVDAGDYFPQQRDEIRGNSVLTTAETREQSIVEFTVAPGECRKLYIGIAAAAGVDVWVDDVSLLEIVPE